MTYAMRRVHRILSVTTLTLLASGLSACIHTTVVSHSALNCLDLIPESNWSEPHADLPPPKANVGDWQVFGNEEAGHVDNANTKLATNKSICQKVDEANKKADQEVSKKWWQFWK